MKKKKCTACLKSKAIDQFRRNGHYHDGKCKSCKSKYGVALKRKLLESLHGPTVARQLMSNVRRGAWSRNLTVKIDAEWIKQQLKTGKCAATGIRFDYGKSSGKFSPWQPTVDRIDSSVGYIPANCHVVCWAYNRAKGDGSHGDLIKLAKALLKR